MHIRLFNFDEVQLCCGIKFNGARVSFLAHHLLVDLRLWRNIDDEVTLNLRLARQPPIISETLDAFVARLHLVEGGGVAVG